MSMHHALIKHAFTVHGSYKNNPNPNATYKLDLSDSDSIESLARLLRERGMKLDSLILNSGVSSLGPQLAIPHSEYEEAFRINFLGPRHVLQAFLPLLKPNAKILLIGSMSSWGALPLTGAYGISKRTLREFWEILRQEFALDSRTKKMKLILVEPGSFKTPIWATGEKSLKSNLPNLSILHSLLPRLGSMGSNPNLFGEKILKILISPRPCSYYRFGAFSFVSRLTPLLPISVRILFFRLMKICGVEI